MSQEWWTEISDVDTAKKRISHDFNYDYKLEDINFDDKVVLDFGCGIGRNLKYLVTTNAKEIIGYDFPNMLMLAKEFLSETEISKVRFIPYPVYEFPKVDIIIATIVLQHIDSISGLEEYLIKFGNSLQDTGILYVNSRGYMDASYKIDDTKETRNVWTHIIKYFTPMTILDSDDGTENHQRVFFKRK